MESGQPALLFLVPGCCGTVLLLALAKGELTQLFTYEETKENKDKEN